MYCVQSTLHAYYTFTFFFNDPATPHIYTLSLHDALPISCLAANRTPTAEANDAPTAKPKSFVRTTGTPIAAAAISSSRIAFQDRKSTRLNSSHLGISYAVFCLKKKNERNNEHD